VAQHELTITRGHNVRLDGFGTERESKPISGQGVLGAVATRTPVCDNERVRCGVLGRVVGHSTTVRDTVEGMSDVRPASDDVRVRPRLNALAVAALILAVLFSPLAALFGHIAAAQIARSAGQERGAPIAWVAVGLGYLWLVAALVVGVAVWLFFTS